jgi:hypothetical protein
MKCTNTSSTRRTGTPTPQRCPVSLSGL